KAASHPVVIHPVAIKYWMLTDPTPALDDWLGRHERRLFWPPRPGRPLVERVERLTSAFLALAEVEVLGGPRAGDVDGRIQRLEETLTDRADVPAVPMGVVVEVAPGLRVSGYPRPKREGRAGGDPLLKAVATSIQATLDRLLAEGSPWRQY